MNHQTLFTTAYQKLAPLVPASLVSCFIQSRNPFPSLAHVASISSRLCHVARLATLGLAGLGIAYATCYTIYHTTPFRILPAAEALSEDVLLLATRTHDDEVGVDPFDQMVEALGAMANAEGFAVPAVEAEIYHEGRRLGSRGGRRRLHGARFTSQAADAARVIFGLPNDTPENRLAVGRYIRRWMNDQANVRHTDVARCWPIATEAVFVPTEENINAANFRRSAARRDWVQDYNLVAANPSSPMDHLKRWILSWYQSDVFVRHAPDTI
jgi:hypothetical protein